MFEKFGQLAEQMATSVSRRQFLGRFGGGAMAVAAAAAGLLALPAVAHAAPDPFCAGGDVRCMGKRVGDPCGELGGGVCRKWGKTLCFCHS